MPPSGPVRPISTPRSRRALTIASARSGPDVDARHQPPGPHLADAGQRVAAAHAAARRAPPRARRGPRPRSRAGRRVRRRRRRCCRRTWRSSRCASTNGSARSPRVITAATGKPLPIGLPSVMTSGTSPRRRRSTARRRCGRSRPGPRRRRRARRARVRLRGPPDPVVAPGRASPSLMNEPSTTVAASRVPRTPRRRRGWPAVGSGAPAARAGRAARRRAARRRAASSPARARTSPR